MKTTRFAVVLEELVVCGANLCSLQYCYVLAELGYPVTLLVLKEGGDIEVRPYDNLTVEIFSYPLTVKELSSIYDRFDAVIIHNSPMAPFQLESTRFAQKPLTVELLHSVLKAGQAPSVDMSIAVSEEVYKKMQPKEQDILVDNGVDTRLFRPASIAKERVRLIQIAQEGKKMDPDIEIIGPELIAEGLPVDIHIIGREGKSTERITYWGVVRDQEKLVKLLQEADVLYHLSCTESFGMTAVEAMATGTIPIVSNVGGLWYSVIDEKTGYVVELGDTERVKNVTRSLVEKIRSGHPDVTNLIEQGILRVDVKYDLQKNIGKAAELMVERVASFERKNRLSTYPFSFIAPMLYFFMGDNDRYFAIIGDIYPVEDAKPALQNWKAFIRDIQPEWQSVPEAYWTFLDRIYTQMALEEYDTVNKENIYSFWLGTLGIQQERYDLTKHFLQKCGLYSGGDIHPDVLQKLFFGVVINLLQVRGFQLPENIQKIGVIIKEAYLLNDAATLEGLSLDNSVMQNFFQGSGYPDVAKFFQ